MLKNLRKNVNIKITVQIFAIFFSACLIAFLINPLIENINYLGQINEGFLFIVYIGLIYSFVNDIKNIFLGYSYFDISTYLLYLTLFAGNVVPLILIFKRKKFLPYIIIYVLFLGIYLFLGIVFFGIRHGEF